MQKIERSESSELGKKSISAFMLQIAGLVVSFFWVFAAGRLLGALLYGQVAYVLSILNILLMFSKFGFDEGLVAAMAREDITEGQKNYIISFCLRICVAISVFVLLVTLCMRNYIIARSTEGNTILFVWMLPLLILETLFMLLLGILRGSRAISQYCIASNIVKNVVRLFGLFFFCKILHWQSLFCMVIPIYISDIVGIGYCIWFLTRNHIYRHEKEFYDHCKVLRLSLPMFLTSAIAVINSNIDKYMIGNNMEASQVGIYSIAVKIGEVTSIALIAVNSIFAPLIANLYSRKEVTKLKSLYVTATKWIVTINIMIFGMVLLFSSDIMRIAGEEFTVGGTALFIVIFGQVVNSGVGSVGYLNTMTGKPAYNTVASIVAVLLNIGLNLILIPKYGIVGAAVASAVSVITCNLINFAFVYFRLHMHPYNRKYLGVLVASATGILVLAGMKCLLEPMHYFIRLLVCGAVYVSVYSILCYLLVCDDDERKVPKRIVKKLMKLEDSGQI